VGFLNQNPPKFRQKFSKMLEIPDNLTPTEQAIFYVTQYPCPHCLLPKCSTDTQRNYFLGLQKVQNLIAVAGARKLQSLFSEDSETYKALEYGWHQTTSLSRPSVDDVVSPIKNTDF
jgi:hypothetical protein